MSRGQVKVSSVRVRIFRINSANGARHRPPGGKLRFLALGLGLGFLGLTQPMGQGTE